MYLNEGFGYSYEQQASDKTDCSELQWLITRRATGLDIQKVSDKWRPMVKVLKNIGIPGMEKLPTDSRVISPSGFAWQKDLTERVEIVDLFKPRTPRLSTVLSQEEYRPLNPSAAAIVERLATYESEKTFENTLRKQASQVPPSGSRSIGTLQVGYIPSHQCPPPAHQHRLKTNEASHSGRVKE